jgi:hypothetical protein
MWISLSRRSPSASPRRLTTHGLAIRRLLQAAILAAWALLAVAAPAGAEGAVRVIGRQQSFVFSESLDFELQVENALPVTDVILFYGRDGVPVMRRIYPPYQPGATLDVSYSETLERGQFAPGTRLRTWWRLELKDGSTLETDVQYLDYTDTTHDWLTLSGERAYVHYYGRDADTANTVQARAEEAIARLQDEIGVQLERPVHLYVYTSSDDMSLALGERSQGYDSRVVTLGVAVSEDTLLLLGSHRDLEQTVAHEMSHLIVGLATANPFSDLPRWLDEGLAMVAEGNLPSDNERALTEAVRRDELLSVRSMSSYSGQASQVDLFYGEAYSVVRYLLDEHGRDKMTALLNVFAQGSRQEDALRQVYGMGLDGLDSAWRASLGLAPRRTPTPQSSVHQPAPTGNAIHQAADRVLQWLRGLIPAPTGSA